MSTITAILEADADGTLHLPLPVELHGQKVKITAELEPIAAPDEHEQQARRDKAVKALEWLRSQGTFKDVDAVAWQREIRQDRPLYGRDE